MGFHQQFTIFGKLSARVVQMCPYYHKRYNKLRLAPQYTRRLSGSRHYILLHFVPVIGPELTLTTVGG